MKRIDSFPHVSFMHRGAMTKVATVELDPPGGLKCIQIYETTTILYTTHQKHTHTSTTTLNGWSEAEQSASGR